MIEQTLPQVADRQPNEGKPQRRKKAGLIAGGLVTGVLLGVVLIGFMTGRWRIGTPELHGMVLQSPQPVANFMLTGNEGQSFSLLDFRGKLVLIYFGYTYCPDVCPATMVELAKVKEEMGKAGDSVQVMMISVDPERDSPEAVGSYVTQFDPSFIGLTGRDEEIAAVAIPLGIYYEKQAGTAATGYLIDHTATVAVIDQEGYLRLIYPFDTAGEDIAADLRYLLR